MPGLALSCAELRCAEVRVSGGRSRVHVALPAFLRGETRNGPAASVEMDARIGSKKEGEKEMFVCFQLSVLPRECRGRSTVAAEGKAKIAGIVSGSGGVVCCGVAKLRAGVQGGLNESSECDCERKGERASSGRQGESECRDQGRRDKRMEQKMARGNTEHCRKASE
jgi:hypothetical protein